MNKLKWLCIFGTLCILVQLLAACSSISISNQNVLLEQMHCYETFSSFAYGNGGMQPSEPMLPKQPWDVRLQIPGQYSERLWDLSFVRYKDNDDYEVWLVNRHPYRGDGQSGFLVFSSATESWNMISNKIEHTEALVSSLHLYAGRDVWGVVDWRLAKDSASEVQGELLSIFDEELKRFVLIDNSPRYVKSSNNSSYPIDVSVGANDWFWFVVNRNHIYVYDITVREIIGNIQMDETEIGVLSPTSDGQAYFFGRTDATQQQSGIIEPNTLFEYSVNSQSIQNVEPPEEPWALLGPPRVTDSNQLWIGPIGYKNLESGQWVLIYEDIDYYLDESNIFSGPTPPQLIFEDENGILWFGSNTESRRGLAWYNLNADEGCMFTNQYGSIFEDTNNELWLLVNDTLYHLR